MKRYYVHTFGCQMNQHDSRRIEEVLEGRGYCAADGSADADVIVFNTCSVREKAEHKLNSAVGLLKPLKQAKPGLTLVVAGCMAQQEGEALLKRIPYVDVLIGPDNIADLPGLIDDSQQSGRSQGRAVFDLEDPRFLQATPRADGSEVTAFVTVMKGCDERCSFCIVPYTRGAERYRSGDDIVSEIKRLVDGGVREVTLLGQTVNSWHEPGQEALDESSKFALLLRRIAHDVPTLSRLRYTSPHPRHVTPELVQAHAELDVLPWHVHLPVQSGSDALLKRMIRRYRRDTYIERARALQACRPGFTLATDIIVGFPGETEEDFEQTLSLVREVGFVAAFGFKYSPRPHTPALKLGDTVPEELKEERLARLFEVTEAQQYAHLRSLVGQRTKVLLEGPSKSNPLRYTGRSHRHELVHVDVPGGVDARGVEVDVNITYANKHSLLGEARDEVKFASMKPARVLRARLPVVSG
jgi:tRNA-2-methylthio-N6-dimethylallyladenosine synthase